MASRSLAHTAHYTTTVKVHYPWHPLYGQEVKAWERKSNLGERCYLILLPDNSHTFMPLWMADEEHCRLLIRQEKASVSLAAMCELASLLKAVAP